MRWRSFLMRLGLIVLLIGGSLVGYRSYEEHQRNAEIQAEIDTLEAEAAKIRRENETLAQKIEYFASPDFQEQEAKQKLGLKRQEETVVALREVPSLDQATSEGVVSERAASETRESIPNYRKWWRLFFE